MSVQSRARERMAWYGPLLVLGGGVCIGLAPIGLRLGLDDLGPQAIAFWRYTLALPFLFLLVIATKRRLPAKPNRFVVIAGTFFALDIGLWHWALTIYDGGERNLHCELRQYLRRTGRMDGAQRAPDTDLG